MDRYSFQPHADPLEADLSTTRRRFLLAREQTASHTPAAQFRAAAVKRRWRPAQHSGEKA